MIVLAATGRCGSVMSDVTLPRCQVVQAAEARRSLQDHSHTGLWYSAEPIASTCHSRLLRPVTPRLRQVMR